MGSLVKKQAEKFLREKQRQRRWLAMFLCLALVVTSGTFAALRMDGRAMDDDGQETICGQEAHQHTAECYNSEDGTLICGMEEHQHSEACYTGGQDIVQTGDGSIPEGGDAVQPETAADAPDLGNTDTDPQGGGQEPGGPNTEAGVAVDDGDGQKRLEDVELTGDWRTDVIETAKSQIGHKEDAGDPEGYERYAAWYGQYVQEHGGTYVDSEAYRENWTSLFVSFCLDYAKVEGIPLQADSRAWMEALAEESVGLYRESSYYDTPQPGDIVFYELPEEKVNVSEGYLTEDGNVAYELSTEEGTGAERIRAGLVEEWNAESGQIKIVAGDLEKDGADQVCETLYNIEDITIYGYGLLPEKVQETTDGTETGGSEEPGNVQEEIDGAAEETQTPEETQAAEETQTPEETQAAEETQTLETTQETEEAQGPEGTQAAEETQEPEGTQAAEETQEPEGTQAAEETQEEIDDSDNMTIDELKALGETQVGSTVYREKGIAAGFAKTMRRMARVFSRTAPQWKFDMYYVNRDANDDVWAMDDFNLKYQMEFHTEQDLVKEAVEIRVNRKLFENRYGSPVTPTQVAVPQAVKDKDGNWSYTESKTTPFNYYIDEEKDQLVFVNYRQIIAGSNAAWQILYRDMKIMEIRNGTDWELEAAIAVRVGEDDPQTDLAGPLCGQVSSRVDLTSVTKSKYKETGKIYTPGLYTESQVKRYIGGELPAEYAGENFKNWKYVVWEVTVKGNATQPWSLILKEDPSIVGKTAEAKIVGYRDHSSKAAGYDLPIRTGPLSGNTLTALQGQTERSWGNRFWVVTAYPADKVIIDDELKNELTVELRGIDAEDDQDIQRQTVDDSWQYTDYEWTYSGDMIGVKKVSDPSKDDDDKRKHKDYVSWLEAYRCAKDRGKDYGDLYYSSEGVFHGYSLTHETSVSGSDAVGTYKPGTSYELTTVDDYMYAYPEGFSSQQTRLGNEDYYYSSVKIRQVDAGYDLSEDMKIKPENPQGTENLDKDVYVYAMLSKPNEAPPEDGWTLMQQIPWDGDSGIMEYTFTPDQIAQEPWRVKVVHRTVEYETVCTIDVRVRLRAGSEEFGEWADLYRSGDQYVQLENLAGVMGRYYPSADDQMGIECHGSSSGMDAYGKPVNYTQYEGLEEESKELYEVETAPQRDDAFVELYGLKKEAHAYKRVEKTSNDVEKSRALVDYCLTAYDGYQVFDQEAAGYMESMGVPSPGQKYLMFCDLLPQGMYFDPSEPVTAGRIMELDDREHYKSRPGYWNGSQVTVNVDPKEDIIDDWNGTGRTMVRFHIVFSGEDPAVYTNGKWMEGWGVSFRAYYEWKDTESILEQHNISAFMPDTDPNSESSRELLGEGTVYKNGNVPPNAQEGGAPGVYDDFANAFPDKDVLYADYRLKDGEATAANSSIEKTVRADADIYGVYSTQAYVEEGEDYTYNVTVTAADKGLKDIVVFDHLENAKEDRKTTVSDPNHASFKDDEHLWYGTFRAVATAGLEKQGVQPVVWYNTNRNAVTPDNEKRPENVLVSENGWYKKDDLIQNYRDDNPGTAETDIEKMAFAQVTSVAVDLSKRADGTAFELEKGQSLSFWIRMRAPKKEEEKEYTCAYNNPSYYSKPADGVETRNPYWSGNSVRVYLNDKKDLEVAKVFKSPEDVPSALQDRSFEFQIYRVGKDNKKEPLANKGYTLYVGEKMDGLPHAADADGKFTLRAGERAVFKKIADADNVLVKETENIFWEAEIVSDNTGDVSKRIVKNTYRPVLYVQKELKGVPEGMAGQVKEQAFHFQVKVDGKAGKIKYCQVDRAALNGGIPDIIKGPDGEEIQETDENGRFTIKEGQIFALFVGSVDARYELTELNEDGSPIAGDKGVGEDWICENPTVSGNVPYTNTSASITNYYKWKDLYLTKKITHQDPLECKEKFTFQISKINGDGTTTPISGNEWVVLDENGGETDPKNTVGADGRLTCACAGKTVLVKKLEAGTTYRIEEIVEENGDLIYLPVNGEGKREVSKDVWMPVYSSSRDVTFINDYRMRSLSVSKTVVTSDGNTESGDREFTMIVHTKKGNGTEPFANKPYKLEGQEGTQNTEADGSFKLKAGQKAVFEDAGKAGDAFVIWEVKDSECPQIYPSGETTEIVGRQDVGAPHQIELSNPDMETEAKFINGQKGLLLVSKEYGSRDGEEEGSPANDYLEDTKSQQDLLKEYKQEFARIKKEMENDPDSLWTWESLLDSCIDHIKRIREELWSSRPYVEGVVKARLTVSAGDGTWIDWVPKQNDEIKIIEQLTGDVYSAKYSEEKGCWTIEYTLDGETVTLGGGSDAGGMMRSSSSRALGGGMISRDDTDIFGSPGEGEDWNILLRPWITYVFPMEPETEYRLEEIEFNRGMLGAGDSQWAGGSERPAIDYMVTQKIPEEGESIQGTVQERPAAKLLNEVRSAKTDFLINKYMAEGSGPVAPGAKMVWRIERYDGSRWEPADGIEYAIAYGSDPLGQIQQTGDDGEIQLIYPQVQTPEADPGPSGGLITIEPNMAVQFFTKVWLNREEDAQPGDLRVIEIPQKTDASWGVLAGYGIKGYRNQYYSMDVPSSEAAAFVNTNASILVNVEKKTHESYGRTFKMILKQKKKAGLTETSEPYPGISYQVYDKTTGREVGSVKRTTENGEIFLEDGQYAQLRLPSGFMWEIAEDVDHAPNFNLNDLTVSGNNVDKVSENLAQVDTEKKTSTNPDGTTYITPLDRACGVYTADGTKVLLNGKDVTIPEKILRDGRECVVKGIEMRAFAESKELVHVEFPKTIVTIKTAAFMGCTALETVSIPVDADLKTIGVSAFAGCTRLKEITLPQGLTDIRAYAFRDCSSLTNIAIPDSVTNIYEGAFSGCGSLADVEIGNGLTEIMASTFEGCTMLNGVSIPDNITSIGESAFKDCRALQSIKIPDSVTKMGQGVFKGCSSLKDVTIGQGIKTIPSAAFENCESIENIVIPEGVEKIQGYASSLDLMTGERMGGAFDGCKALKTISIPSTIKFIGRSSENDSTNRTVFNGCTALEEMRINLDIENYDSGKYDKIFGHGIFGDCGNTDLGLAVKVNWNATGHMNPPYLPQNSNPLNRVIYGDGTILLASKSSVQVSVKKNDNGDYQWNQYIAPCKIENSFIPGEIWDFNVDGSFSNETRKVRIKLDGSAEKIGQQ